MKANKKLLNEIADTMDSILDDLAKYEDADEKLIQKGKDGVAKLRAKLMMENDKPTPEERAQEIIRILKEAPEGKTTNKIAEHLGVSRITVGRDVKLVENLLEKEGGFQLECEHAGRNLKNFKLVPLQHEEIGVQDEVTVQEETVETAAEE